MARSFDSPSPLLSASPETIIRMDGADIVIEDPALLFSAEFKRDGSDLILDNQGHAPIRIIDYFKGDERADLVSGEGSILKGELVEILAGPAFPGQLAQAAGQAVAAGDAIGQVENLTGNAFVQRADGTVEQLTLKTKVFQNDVVRTEEGATLSITFADGTIFTLAASSRMVLNELIYDPSSNNNSGTFNLIEGTFVFIAGQVAKTGGMEVSTPAATMGIRGTTVKVDIQTINGITTVEVSLNRDPDGDIGQFTITGLDGNLIANVTATDTKWIISPVEGQTREVPRTIDDLNADQIIITAAYDAFNAATARVNAGGQFVESGDGQPDEPGSAPQLPQDDPNQEQDPEQRGDLGSSGIDTEIATDSQGSGSTSDVTISELGGEGLDAVGASGSSGGTNPPVTGSRQSSTESPSSSSDRPIETAFETGPTDTAPRITVAGNDFEVPEDGAVVLSGFSITDPDNSLLTATLIAGSTVTLVPGSGVTIVEGTGVNDVRVVIQGTAAQLNAALNGLIYNPSPNADTQGTLSIEISDGTDRASLVMVIRIVPGQDAPVAVADTAVRNENDNLLVGNLISNDSDPDVTPTPDVLRIVEVRQGVTTSGPIAEGGFGVLELEGGGLLIVFSDGTYSFDPGSAYDGLQEGQSITESVTYVLTDGFRDPVSGELETVTSTLEIVVNGVNNVPVLSGDGLIDGSLDVPTVLTTSDVNAFDPDTAPELLVFTITSGPTQGQLELVSNPGVAITSFTQADLSAGSVVYVHTGSPVSTDAFSFTVDDGSGPVPGFVSIAFPNNNDPSVTGLPTILNASEDTLLDVDLSGSVVLDPDANGAAITLTLSPITGTLTAISTAAVVATQLGSAITLQGTVDALTTYLNVSTNIQYLGGTDLFGTTADTITVVANDGGNTGFGGGLDVTVGSINVSIDSINDDPQLTGLPSSITTPEDTLLNIGFPAFNVIDPDLDGGAVVLTVSSTAGGILTMEDASTGGPGIVGSGTSTVTLTGTADQLASFFSGSGLFTYTPPLNLAGTNADQITFTINDQGATGAGGGADILAATISMDITPINDAPSIGSLFNDLDVFQATAGANVDVVRFSDGQASFSTAGTFVAHNSTGIDIADWDFDGDLDIVLANGDAGASKVLDNNGDGTFTDISIGTDGRASQDVVFANLDGAGGLDIVFAETFGNTGSAVLIDALSGQTRTDVLFGSGFSDINRLIAVDITGDGRDEIIYAATSNGSAGTPNGVLFNDGSGGLFDSGLLLGNADSTSVVAGDIDGDLDIDLIFSGNNGTNTEVFLNLGGGYSATPDSIISSTGNVNDLALADFDGDGDLDVLLVSPDGSGIELHKNDGSGTFTPFGSALNIARAASVAVGDLDSDGDIDAVIGVANGTDPSRILLNDGNGNFTIAAETLDVLPVSDLALADFDGDGREPAIVNEDEEASLSGFSFFDIDAGSNPVQLTISVNNGTLLIADAVPGGVLSTEINYVSGSEVVITSTLAQINATMQNPEAIGYLGNPNFNGLDTLTFELDDLGSGLGTGEALTATRSMIINVVPINDAPTLTTTSGANSYGENDPAVAVDPLLTLTDPDGSELTGATVRITLPGFDQDVLSFTNTTNITGTYDASTATLTLTGNATVAEYQAALRSVTYSNTSENPDVSTRDVEIQVFDSSQFSNFANKSIDIEAVNDAPTLSGVPASFSLDEDTTFTFDLTALGINDVDSDEFSDPVEVKIKATNGSFDLPPADSGITPTFGTDSSEIIITGTRYDLSFYFAINGGLQFTPDADYNGPVTIRTSVSDLGSTGTGGAQTDFIDSSGTVNAVNDGPVLFGFPSSIAATEDTTSLIDLSEIEIRDVDAGSADISVTLSITGGGSLSLTPNALVTLSGNTITGSIANINAYFDTASFTYTPPADVNGNSTDYRLAVSVNDAGNTGSGGPQSITGFVNFDIAAVNDEPFATGFSGGLLGNTIVEDTPTALDLTAITLFDVDAGSGTLLLTLDAASGQLSATSGGGVTVTQISAGEITLEGTLADLNSFISGPNIIYTPVLNLTGAPADGVNVKINDQGNTGSGGLTDVFLGTVEVTVTPDNDPPEVTTSAGNETFTEGDDPIAIDSAITVGDVDDVNIEGAFISISSNFESGTDVLGFADTGSITGSYNTDTGLLTLTGTATVAEYQAALRSITFESTSATPSEATRIISFIVSDGDDQSLVATRDLAVVEGTEAPTLSLSYGASSYTENAGPAFIDVTANIADADSPSLAGATVTISANFVAGEDALGFTNVGNITGTYDASTGILTFTGTDTIANYKFALESVTFFTNSENPSTNPRDLTFQVSDGTNSSTAETVTVGVIAVNDAPSISLANVTDGVDLILNGGFEDGPTGGLLTQNITSNGGVIPNWNVVDVDHSHGFWQNGDGIGSIDLNGFNQGSISQSFTTTIGTTYELTYLVAGNPSGDALKDYNITIGNADVNLSYDITGNTTAAMGWEERSLFFQATSTTTTVTFTSLEIGQSAGPALDNIAVQEVSGGAVTTTVDTPVEISNISIVDLDATGPVTVTLAVSGGGTLLVNNAVPGGLSATDISGNGTGLVTLTGTLTAINTTLAISSALIYQGAVGFSGVETITVAVNDLGQTGTGGAQTDTAAITVTVNAGYSGPAASTSLVDITDGTAQALFGYQFSGDGGAPGSDAGRVVSAVGDINNDGIEDFAIGAPNNGADTIGFPEFAGSTYIIYGQADPSVFASLADATGRIDLDTAIENGRGFELVSPTAGDRLGVEVTGTGDINGDGIDDLVVGAPFTDNAFQSANPGAAYVIFGGQDFEFYDNANNEIDVTSIGGISGLEGFQLLGTQFNGNLGQSVSIVGDINFDGIDDLFVGNPTQTASTGSGWIIYGGQDFWSATTVPGVDGTIYLNPTLPPGLEGFQLIGENIPDLAGYSVEFVGDFNNDGIDDLVIGSLQNNNSGAGSTFGKAHIIFGGQDFAALTGGVTGNEISLASVGGGTTGDPLGFQLVGEASGDGAGLVVGSAGDFNNDGIADLLVTAQANSDPDAAQGATYIIFGGQAITGTQSLSEVGDTGAGATISGIKFRGEDAGDRANQAALAGDINGDGIDDLIIGASWTAAPGSNTGATYIVYGGQAGLIGDIDLDAVGTTVAGFRITGEAAGNFSGESVSAAGDVNGDGFDDLLIGAPINGDGGSGAGAGYIVYGGNFSGANVITGTSADNMLNGSTGADTILGLDGNDGIVGAGGADVLRGGRGNDTLEVSDLSFQEVDGAQGLDTLVLNVSSTINLGNISSRISSIEAIDLTSGGVSDVGISLKDVFNITDTGNDNIASALDLFHSNALAIFGETGDNVTFAPETTGTWIFDGSFDIGGTNFNILSFEQAGSFDILATVAIDDEVTYTIA